jgi:tousled-like kinase
LEEEKAAHIREYKRCTSEDRSRFVRDLPLLNVSNDCNNDIYNNKGGGPYLLQELLGRGGFSEVWKAMDFQYLCEVAVKVHQLNSSWTEERKNSYIKHVTREYNIHCSMKHERVVRYVNIYDL